MNNQNFFQISADFDLKSKPEWIDSFRLKYDLPYDYHITFKTTTNFNDEDFENLNIGLKEVLEKYKPFVVIFDELFIAPAPSGWCIMIKAKHNEDLFKLQKEIVERFSKFGTHPSKQKEEFEKNFDPHITIARHLSDEQLEQAKGELKDDLTCEALIDSTTLTTTKGDTFEEWSKPENRKFYKFNK
ncbi:MAG: 2'-5' RNA ligase family protein [Patescibacteria group bacterium]|nr:2'-5' RNA ligase family protein [Patescibacteria group bacterium]